MNHVSSMESGRARRLVCSAPPWCLAALLLGPVAALAAADDIAAGEIQLAQGATPEPEEAGSEDEAPDYESDTTPPPGVEVLRVRGRGVAALEVEVPASVTQFDSATIEALGAQDISDLSRVTPNVNIVQPGNQATFFVRGVGLSDFSSNAAGAVTILQDHVAINAPAIQTGQIFDVEGVDLLRGPQGAGPFRNASAGAIRVRSRRPTGNYSAQLRTSLGWYDTKGDKGARSSLIQDYEGAVEMPLVDDVLASRFAFRLRAADPWKTNGCGNALPMEDREIRETRIRNPNPPPPRILVGFPLEDPRVSMCGERSTAAVPPGEISTIPEGLPRYVNDEHNWAARGTFRFQPPESEWDIFFNAHGSRLDEDTPVGQAIGTVPLSGATDTTIRYAGRHNSGYVDRDVQEEFDSLCQDTNPGPITQCANTRATQQLAKEIAKDRSLDKRPYRGDYNRVGRTTRDAWGAFLSAEGKVFGDKKLFALTSYDTYERFQESDSDFTPEQLFELVQDDEAWQVYNELQLSGEFRRYPIEWNVGGYYLREELDNDGTFFILTGVSNLDTRRVYQQTIDSFAVWGEFVWNFAEDFTLEGGVRYNWERKQFDFRKIGGRLGGNVDVSTSEEETWATPTGQIILTYHLGIGRAVYLRYTRGFKAGHFNALAGEVTGEDFSIDPADEEYNDAWEAGVRGAWLDGRLQLAAAYFYYRYENYQIFLFTDNAESDEPPVLEIVNAKEAENYGIEVEGVIRPLSGWAPRWIEGLRLSGNFSWLHGEYLNFTTFRRFTAGIPPTTFNASVDYSGRQLQNAPVFKASGTVEWSLDLGRYGYLIPRYDIIWTDDVFFDPNEGRGSIDPTGGPALIEYGVGQKAHFLHNLRLAYRAPTGRIEVAGWIRNLDDQVYKNFAFDASRFSSLVINFPGNPRTIGMDLAITF